MQSTEKDVKLNNERVSFSKAVKRKILMEIIKGKTAKEAFLLHAFDSIKDISSDRDYASKLVHKWRKEVSKNRESFYFINQNITSELLQYEIDEMGSDDEIIFDDIMFDALNRYENMCLNKILCELNI